MYLRRFHLLVFKTEDYDNNQITSILSHNENKGFIILFEYLKRDVIIYLQTIGKNQNLYNKIR